MAVDSKFDFIKMEHDILSFWEEHQCFRKLCEKNKGKERFRFLDGPITANNPMGIHHAWGRSIKDSILRYKAMNGYECQYRNGFDTQGLWVEVEVEKELGFQGKKDIKAYGMDKFTKKCVERITHFSKVIEAQSKRLGQWMDFNHSYFTHTDENISGIWHFLKICHKNGWIMKSQRPMPWCPRCGTSLSEHEMSGSYIDITHTAVFVLKANKYYENYNLSELTHEFEFLVEDVSNWYVRVNRKRFWKDVFDTDKRSAYNSLYYAIKTMAQVMAPILPFMMEYIWQGMVLKYGAGEESIHLSEFPKLKVKTCSNLRSNDVDIAILENAEKIRVVIAQALKLRNEKNLKVKQPLSILYLDSKLESICASYIGMIKDELNVKNIVYLSDFGVLSLEYLSLNFEKAGKYLKGDLNHVKELLFHLTQEEMATCVFNYKNGVSVMINGFHTALPIELFILQTKEKENIVKGKDKILIAIDIKITEELKKEGIYREILRHCQVLRKEAGFLVSDRVMLDFVTDSSAIASIIGLYRAQIMHETLSEICCLKEFVLQKEIEVDDCKLILKIG